MDSSNEVKSAKLDETSNAKTIGDADIRVKLTNDINKELIINNLKDDIHNLNQEKLKLNQIIKDLNAKLLQQKEDTNDIYFFLNKKCDENYEIYTKLQDQLLSEQIDREVSERNLEQRVLDIQASKSDLELKYKLETQSLEEKYATVREHLSHIREHDALVADLRRQLADQQIQYENQIDTMEASMKMEKLAVRVEYDKKLEVSRREIYIQIEKAIVSKHSNAVAENEFLREELSKQSANSDKVAELSGKIFEHEKTLQIQLQLSKSTENELLSRMESYQTTVKNLNDRLFTEHQKYEAKVKELEETINGKDNTIRELSEQLEAALSKLKLEDIKKDDLWSYLSNAIVDLKQNLKTNSRRESSKNSSMSSTASAVGNFKHHSHLGDVSSTQSSQSFLHSNNQQDDYSSHFIQNEKILVELIELLAEKYPKRFRYRYVPIFENSFANEQSHGSLPPVKSPSSKYIQRQNSDNSSTMSGITYDSRLAGNSYELQNKLENDDDDVDLMSSSLLRASYVSYNPNPYISTLVNINDTDLTSASELVVPTLDAADNANSTKSGSRVTDTNHGVDRDLYKNAVMTIGKNISLENELDIDIEDEDDMHSHDSSLADSIISSSSLTSYKSATTRLYPGQLSYNLKKNKKLKNQNMNSSELVFDCNDSVSSENKKVLNKIYHNSNNKVPVRIKTRKLAKFQLPALMTTMPAFLVDSMPQSNNNRLKQIRNSSDIVIQGQSMTLPS